MTSSDDKCRSDPASEILIDQIMHLIPHRFPFLLVDRILSLDPVKEGQNCTGRTCVALKNVTINEPFFTGHFPHKPIMPGVLIVEAMAQAAAICAHRPSPGVEMEVLIAAIDKAKFRRPVVPGDQLIMKIEILKDRGKMFLVRGVTTVQGQVVAEAEMLATSFPKKEK